jgi:hypothetical protein
VTVLSFALETCGFRVNDARTMATPDVRSVLLQVIEEIAARRGAVFDEAEVITEARKRLGAGDIETQHALLDSWQDLYRLGVVSWGLNAENQRNWSHPWVHLTPMGKKTIANVSRDPSNPRGYLATLELLLRPGTIARSYIEEAVRTYAAGCDKATAVMVGAAAETLTIELRDALVARMVSLTKTPSRKLTDWRIKTVLDGLEDELMGCKKAMPPNLFERFETFWAAFAGLLRMVRNDAGHPKAVDPVTRDAVHSTLLVFPEHAKLAVELTGWVSSSYT